MAVALEQPYLDFIAANVRRRREALGLTQEQAAEAGSFDVRYYRFIEAADRNISIRVLVRLAEALGCPPAALLRPTHPLRRRPGRPVAIRNR